MTMNINSLDASRFKGTAFFAITLRRAYGNRAKIKDATLLEQYLRDLQAELAAKNPDDKTEAKPAVEGLTAASAAALKNAKRINASKVLVNSPALDALNRRMNEIKSSCLALCMPSFVRDGLFVAKLEIIPQIEEIVRAGREEVETVLLPAFLAEFPEKQREARELPLAEGGLGCLYVAGDYPDDETLSRAFEISTNWLSLNVADGLPPELRQAESEKLTKKFTEAADDIRQALRVMFSDLIGHATEKLTVEPGAKTKIFRDTLVTNIKEFCDTFAAKDIMGDAELSLLVNKAKEIVGGTDAEKLRKFASVRDATANALTEIQKQLDPIVKAGRKFDLSDDNAEG